MSLTVVPAAGLIHRLAEFDTLIDARSEAEFDEDRLPGAVNWPTLNNAERILIGTTYKQVNAFEAKKRGAALAARNIAAHIEQHCLGKPKDWKPLAYCWRGGKRSGSLSLILDQIGFKVTLVEGGYKAYRAEVRNALLTQPAAFDLHVICGRTGSGKTRLLHALAAKGCRDDGQFSQTQSRMAPPPLIRGVCTGVLPHPTVGVCVKRFISAYFGR